MYIDLDLRLLRYFVALAEKLHFGHAADELNISQPVLSRQIRLLEMQLGSDLFERTSRAVKLTNAGQVLYPQAQRTLQTAATAIALAKSAADGNAGHLRIGFLPSAGIELVPRIVRAYSNERPNVILQLEEMFDEELMAALNNRDIDIAFTRLEGIREQSLGYKSALYVVVASSHPLASRQQVEFSELAEENFIWWPANIDPLFRAHYIAAAQQAGFVLNIVQEIRSIQTIIGLVAAELGVTLLASEYLALQRPELKFIKVKGMASTLRLAWHPDGYSNLLQGFVDTVKSLTKPPSVAEVMSDGEWS